ncbi:hypothetical protein ABI59_18990 [Acidobacteria bacterium Mor1]|nr:hypothetical protein ABI59_18990 [Acidobacteria bacterium Mor1]
MSRARHIGIQITPEAVHMVAVGSGKPAPILAQAHVTVDSIDQIAGALGEAITTLGHTAPARVVVFGIGAQHFSLRLPDLNRGEIEQALRFQAGQVLNEAPEAFLIEHHSLGKNDDGGTDYQVLAIPREPLETWAGRLTRAGCPVEYVATPATMVMSEIDPEDSLGTLWAEVGAPRTCLSLFRGREINLSRELPRRSTSAEPDPMADVERRLADFQEIERSIIYFRENTDASGVGRLVLSGAAAEIEPFREQLLPPLQQLHIEVELDDAFAGLEVGDVLEPTQAVLCSPAGRIACTRKPPLSICPEVSRAAVVSKRKKLAVAIGASAAAVVMLYAALLQQMERSALQGNLDRARTQLELLYDESGNPDAEDTLALQVDPARVPNWAGLLQEIGLLVDQGVSYGTIELSHRGDRPRVALHGRVERPTTGATGDAVAELYDGLLLSPFARDLPDLTIQSAGGGQSEAVAFRIEGHVGDLPRRGTRP